MVSTNFYIREVDMLISGIDISNNNGTLNWTTLHKCGVTFAYAKATEGLNFTDSYYVRNRAGAKANGIKFGAYHFAHPNNNGQTEAMKFLSVAKVAVGDLIPVLDIEKTYGMGRTRCRQYVQEFAGEIYHVLGVWPMIYSTGYFLDSYVGPRIGNMKLWVAHWDVPTPRMPSGWGPWTVWQDGIRNIGGRSLDHDKSITPLPIYTKGVVPMYPAKYIVLRRSALALHKLYVTLPATWKATVQKYIVRWVTEGR
jgi:lysozyme